MRKQVARRIFVAFLCVSGFAQMADISGETQLVHLQRRYKAARWNTGAFERAWKSDAEPGAVEGLVNSCASTRMMLLEAVACQRGRGPIHDVAVWRLPNSQAFFFVSGMTIDADGAPNAYSPDDTGLDELANAGTPAHWDGIVTDPGGNPLVQNDGDPSPGYYISCTSLSDKTKKFNDQTAYVDASNIPYVVLPREVADRGGARLGDFAFVMNLRNGRSSFAIYADIGTLGEGSVALAKALGIRSDARRGGQTDGILYLLFAGSGNLRPRTNGEIQTEGERLLLDHAGNMRDLSSCIEDDGAVASGKF